LTNKWFRRPKQDKDQVKKVDQEIENREEEDSLDAGGKQTDREHRHIYPKEGKPERDDNNDNRKGQNTFRLPDRWEPEPEADDIDDLLIFRCILICLLFCTAPDSTEMLS
jgi:hypothetical protein